MREALDGFSVSRDQILVQGNFVAARTRMSGIFEREYAYSPIGPVPPTGKPVSFQIINIFRYDDEGRLAEEWAQLDNLGQPEQLGVDLAAASRTPG
jgi:predicted ester cyclase